MAEKRVVRELHELSNNPAEGIRLHINEQNITEVQADIDGPVGTPYEGGVFRCRLSMPPDYPAAPPKGHFITKIFHPNVSLTGEICVNVLKKDWTPDLGIRHVLVVIKCLLVHTNPESALNEEAGRLLLENYDEFAAHARLMTSIHAQSRRPGPLTTSNANAQAGTTTHETGGAEKAGSPASKKAKADQPGGPLPTAKPTAVSKPALAAKKSLKRL